MTAQHAYIRRETAISVAINVVLSLAFFLLIFGLSGAVDVWGPGGYVFDFAPQGFMIALMGTLVPGFLALRASKGGRIAGTLTEPSSKRSLVLRALSWAALSAGIGVALAATSFAAAAADSLSWWPALLTKLVFGGVLAAFVTPIGLRATLGLR